MFGDDYDWSVKIARMEKENAGLRLLLTEARLIIEEAALLPSHDGGWKDWCDEAFADICEALGDCSDHGAEP